MYNHFVKLVWIVTYLVFWPIIRLRWKVARLVAPDVFTAQKPLILVSNHRSIFDPWIVCINLPFRTFLNLLPIRILGTREFIHPASRILNSLGIVSLIYFFYGVPIFKKNWTFEEKLEPLVRALRDGETAMIFPEGSIQTNPELGGFRRGAAYLAEKTYRPLLPVSIRFTPNRNNRTVCRLNYGEPLMMPPEFNPNDPADQKRASDYLRNIVGEMYNR